MQSVAGMNGISRCGPYVERLGWVRWTILSVGVGNILGLVRGTNE